jgi:O-antigen/teichoic acid export membrane protein
VDLGTTYVAGGLSVVSGLVLLPVAAGTIGLETYGIWLTFSAIQQLFFALDLGLPVTLVRFTAAARPVAGRTIADVWALGRRALLLMGGGQFLIFLPVALVVRALGDLEFDALPLVLLGAGVFLLGVPIRLPLHVLQGSGHYATTSIHLIVGTLLGQSLKVGAMFSGAPGIMLWLAAGDVVTLALPGILSYAWLRRSPDIDVRRRVEATPSAVASRSRDLLRFAGGNAVLTTSGSVVTYTGTIFVAMLLSPSAVSVYDAAIKVFQGGRRLQDMLIGPLLPWTTRQVPDSEEGRAGPTEMLYLRLSRLVALPVAAALVVLIYVTPHLLDLWVGARFQGAVTPLRLLLVVLLLQTLLIPGLLLRQARNRMNGYAVLTALWMILCVAATGLLVDVHGLTGAALGALIPLAIVFIPLLLVNSSEFADHWFLPVREIAIAATVLGLIASAGALFAMRNVVALVAGLCLAAAGLTALIVFMRSAVKDTRGRQRA